MGIPYLLDLNGNTAFLTDLLCNLPDSLTHTYYNVVYNNTNDSIIKTAKILNNGECSEGLCPRKVWSKIDIFLKACLYVSVDKKIEKLNKILEDRKKKRDEIKDKVKELEEKIKNGDHAVLNSQRIVMLGRKLKEWNNRVRIIEAELEILNQKNQKEEQKVKR
ncbi:MAG: hypothetical protein M1454_04240 [Candidatus Thermoplasmatota archaeon]|nr:hypothetical protein [Candidatus Thermoplasmatota archaeon]MCL5730496.1 hypothetical protein [Candidatus Thermoplasmatota archaeon]